MSDGAVFVALFLWATSRRDSVPTRRSEAERIALLSPAMRQRLGELLGAILAETGVLMIVGSTVRTEAEQDALLASGKSHARGPRAPHVRGVAVDLYEPPGAPTGTRELWHAIARRLGWFTFGPRSWDAVHAEWRGQ